MVEKIGNVYVILFSTHEMAFKICSLAFSSCSTICCLCLEIILRCSLMIRSFSIFIRLCSIANSKCSRAFRWFCVPSSDLQSEQFKSSDGWNGIIKFLSSEELRIKFWSRLWYVKCKRWRRKNRYLPFYIHKCTFLAKSSNSFFLGWNNPSIRYHFVNIFPTVILNERPLDNLSSSVYVCTALIYSWYAYICHYSALADIYHYFFSTSLFPDKVVFELRNYRPMA